MWQLSGRAVRTRVVAALVVAATAMSFASACTGKSSAQAPTKPAIRDASGNVVASTARPLKSHAPDDSLRGFSRALGKPYNISPTQLRKGLRVTFPVNDNDLDAVGGYRPSVSNLFIAIYEPRLRTWVPLATTYTASSHTISAIAPHFSSFWKRVVDTVVHVTTTVANVVASAVTGVEAFLQQLVDTVGEVIRESFFPRQESANCSAVEDSHYTVTPQLEKLPGCVSTQSGSASLLLENHYHLPFDLIGPDGSNSPAPSVSSVGDLIAGWIQNGFGHGYLAPLGVTQIGMSESLRDSNHWREEATPDLLAIAFNVIFAILQIIPGESAFEDEVLSLRVEITREVEAEGAKVSSTRVLDLVISRIRTVAVPGVVEFADALNDGIECVHGIIDRFSTVQASVDDALKAILGAAKDCGGSILSHFKASLSDSLDYVLNLLGAIPDLYNAARATGQLADITFGNNEVTAIDIVHGGNETPLDTPPFGEGTVLTGFSNADQSIVCSLLDLADGQPDPYTPYALDCSLAHAHYPQAPCPNPGPLLTPHGAAVLIDGPGAIATTDKTVIYANDCNVNQEEGLYRREAVTPNVSGVVQVGHAASCDVRGDQLACVTSDGHGFRVTNDLVTTF